MNIEIKTISVAMKTKLNTLTEGKTRNLNNVAKSTLKSWDAHSC